MPIDPALLRALRQEAGLTVRALQREAGIANPNIYRLESGDRGEAVPVATLERLADTFGRLLGRRVTVDELLTPTNQPEPPKPETAPSRRR